MKKLLISFLSLLVILVFIFFWASSGALKRDQLYTITKPIDNKIISKDTISIMTYNIGYLSGLTNNKPLERKKDLFDKNANALIDLLREHKVDILAIQEIDFNSDRSFNTDQLDLIKSRMNFNFTSKAVNWDKRYVPFPYWPPKYHFGKIVSGQAIASRFPIFSNDVEILTKPVDQDFYYNSFYLDRLIQIDTLSINGQPVLLMNVHLEAFSTKTRALHIQKVFKLFTDAIKNGPVLLVGDFNESSFSGNQSMMRPFYEHPGIGSAIPLDTLKQNINKHFTYNSERPDRKIDYIFYAKNYVEAFELITITKTKNLSDHLPVMMRFKLKSLSSN